MPPSLIVFLSIAAPEKSKWNNRCSSGRTWTVGRGTSRGERGSIWLHICRRQSGTWSCVMSSTADEFSGFVCVCRRCQERKIGERDGESGSMAPRGRERGGKPGGTQHTQTNKPSSFASRCMLRRRLQDCVLDAVMCQDRREEGEEVRESIDIRCPSHR